MPDSRQAVASAADIRKILGPVDDELVIAIRHTGATPREVLQAFQWANDDDYIGAELGKKADDRIRAVYDLLLEDLDRDEERRR